MPMIETVRAKIGATILDVMHPGWADEIDSDLLNLASCHSCVLGQLFGEFDEGAETLFAMRAGGTDAEAQIDDAARAAGFLAIKPGSKSYSRLTRAWRREIAKRVAA